MLCKSETNDNFYCFNERICTLTDKLLLMSKTIVVFRTLADEVHDSLESHTLNRLAPFDHLYSRHDRKLNTQNAEARRFPIAIILNKIMPLYR